MKSEDQRIAFLQYLGWTDLIRDSKLGNYRALRGTSPEGKKNQIAPNPLTNLNVIHEARKTLITINDRCMYANYLWDCMNETHWDMCDKTAQEQLKAFLKTVDLWKE